MDSSEGRFGTFGGVFTPSILTILGVIMFMRAGFVIGNAGILAAIAILLVAKGITVATGLSLSAIGTNMEVRGGGAYFLISRVLGPEFGGAIGLALFSALALSVPFYILGFTEALLLSFPMLTAYAMPLTFVVAGLMLGIAYVGADWAIRAQFVIMGVLAISILAFLGGAAAQFSWATFEANLRPEYAPQASGGTYGFWLIFAIFFPAVTGIDAGVNMSGDLKDPARSLPRGTLAAIGVGFVVYLVQIVICGGAFTREALIAEPYGVLVNNALFGAGFLVAGGVYAATLSSALGSCLGAPRVLQAVSRDPILGFLAPFGKGAGESDEPRRALLLTAVITAGVLVWAGQSGGSGGAALNTVAAIITMFFLYTYGMVNLAAFIEAFSQNPSWRPRFRFFHWSVALLGGVACVVAAFLIDVTSALVAVLLIVGLLGYLKTRELRSTFTDARRGFVFSNLRKNLLRLANMREDAKNWRPTLLVFSGNPALRELLVTYGVWLEAGRGIVILASVLEGSIEDEVEARRASLQQLTDFCEERALQAVPMVLVAEELKGGILTMLQVSGLGPVHPNLVLFGWSGRAGRLGGLGRYLRAASAMGMGTLILWAGSEPVEGLEMAAPPEADGPDSTRRIDVWWRGRKNGGLMLVLAHLLTRNWEWSTTRIRILRLVASEAEVPAAEADLLALRDASRLVAESEALVSDRPFPEILREQSGDASVVFLGFMPPEEGKEEAWKERLDALLGDLGTTTILTHAEGIDDDVVFA